MLEFMNSLKISIFGLYQFCGSLKNLGQRYPWQGSASEKSLNKVSKFWSYEFCFSNKARYPHVSPLSLSRDTAYRRNFLAFSIFFSCQNSFATSKNIQGESSIFFKASDAFDFLEATGSSDMVIAQILPD